MNSAIGGSFRDSRIDILVNCSHKSINSPMASGLKNKMLTGPFFGGIMAFLLLMKVLRFLMYKKR